MFCHDCGRKAKENSIYCENCGTKLKPVKQQSQANPAPTVQQDQTPASKRKKLLFILIASGLIIIGLTVALIFIFRGDQQGGKGDDPNSGSSISDTIVDGSDQTDANEQGADFLTAERAREIAQAWLSDNPIDTQSLLDSDYNTEVYGGVEYFRFYLIEPSYYWFSILVHKETGDLYCMLIEDGMDPGPPHVEPLDDWYNNVFRSDIDLLSDLYGAAQDFHSQIILAILWENGENTTFIRAGDSDWIMHSRDGDTRDVFPEFTQMNDVLEIRFPTTTRVYSLYDDHTGIFGSESFRWGVMIS